MKQHKKLIIAGVIAALMLAVIPFAVFAQGNPPPPDSPFGLLRALTDTAAQVLNMEPQDFVQALREGKTPAQLAEEAGVSTDELAAALQDIWNAQGEVLIGKFIAQGPPKGMRPHRSPHRGLFKQGRLWVKVSAETLDMPVGDFVQALRGGQTPAQIAEAHGSSEQALVDAIVAAEKDRLDQAVASGRITQEKADEILARVTDMAGKWVENGFPEHPPRPRRPHRP